MMPAPRKKMFSRTGVETQQPAPVPNLSGSNETSAPQTLDNTDAAQQQWNDAYQQLYDRN